MNGLSPWRVEVLRITRTRRLLALAFLYLFLGASGPLTARYARAIFARLSDGSTVTVTVADPVPADGILGFQRSAMQLGLVACVVVTALAVCLDARPPLSVFYRTRAPVSRVLVPRLAITLLTTGATYSLGFLFAWYETWALLGAPDPSATVRTWGLGLAYTSFGVILAFIASARFGSALGTAGATIAAVLLMPVLGGVRALSHWVPSRLTTLPSDLYGKPAPDSALPALAVAATVAAIGVPLALRLTARRRGVR
ncbi:hypothetical protein OG948_31480 [Embleya sp. NBC_00888]|uniref:hypothetical protein n=1 Tax=Embleya sp. NBC_00888 TaxID=2975960 RepID=UPI0038645824|nr:hypothetical protein OG948_31480 [Embleya sp. NBC_00888]